jgi:hypothetical protein
MSIRQASSLPKGRGPAFSASLFIFFAAVIPAMAAPIPIAGRLTDGGKRGISRATVELMTLASPAESPRPAATVTSDVSGRFHLEAPEPGMWKVIVRSDGYVPLEKSLTPLVELTDLEPTAMTPASLVEIRVEDMDGSPLAGARVRAEPKSDTAQAGWSPAVREGVTGEDGVVRLPHAKDEILMLQAAAAGRLATVKAWASASPVRLRLAPGRERTIEVRSSRGVPARGIDVRTADGVWLVASDEHGRAVISAPASGELALVLESRGFLAGRGTLRPGDASPAVFSLAEPSSASGKAVDAGSRLPVGGALVWPEGHPAAFVRAAGDGSWTVAVAPEAGGRIHAAAPGYLPAETRAAGAPAASPVLALYPRSTGGRAASGVVVDESGRPVAGAAVSLVSASASRMDPLPKAGSTISARSDRQGRFTSRLPAGTWDLQAGAPGRVITVVRGIAVGPGGGPVDLGTVVLRAGASLDGQVVDNQGRPVAGCHVRPLPTDMTSTRFLAAGTEDDGETLSGADGSFTLGGLAPGQPITVRAWREGYTAATLQGVQIPAEKPLRVTLKAASRISGRVIDESGSPVSRAQVLAAPEAGGPGGTAAGPLDENGGFVIENVAPGRVTVVVAVPGFLPARRKGVEVAEGKDVGDLEVVVRKGAVVEGHVLTAAGSPVAGVQIRVLSSTEPGDPLLAALGLAEATSGEDGSYRLEGVPEGRRSISAEPADRPKAVQALAVQPGTNHLDFQLADGREVSGRILDAAGGPVPGATVGLVSSAGIWPATTAPDGGFRISGVPDGTYRLEAEKAGWASARGAEEIRVAGGPVTGLELRLDRGGTIVGRITGLGFEDLSRVQVVASGAAGGQIGNVDYQGSYRIEALAPGDWIVEAQLSGTGRRAVGRVRLEPGQTQSALDLEFGGGLTLTGIVLQGDRPVAGATVTVQGPNGGPPHGGMSGPDGRFRVEGVEPGKVEVVVLGKGTPFRQPLDLSGDREVTLRLP